MGQLLSSMSLPRALSSLMVLFQDHPSSNPSSISLDPSESSSFSDLSFNNIEAIEGLDTLVNLEDLSLSNNRIAKIDSLDALVKLQVLSLGNNQIGNIMNVSTGPGDPCHKYHRALGCDRAKPPSSQQEKGK